MDLCLLLNDHCMCVCRNLTTIDESGSMLSPSDISFDKTEEDLDGSRPVTRTAKRSSAETAAAADDDDDDVRPSGKRSRRDTAVCIPRSEL